MRAVRYWHVTLLGEHYDINHVGLCWDNDLAVSKTIDGPQAEKIKKKNISKASSKLKHWKFLLNVT